MSIGAGEASIARFDKMTAVSDSTWPRNSTETSAGLSIAQNEPLGQSPADCRTPEEVVCQDCEGESSVSTSNMELASGNLVTDGAAAVTCVV